MDLGEKVTSVRGNPIYARDVVDYLKANGLFRNAVVHLIERTVIRMAAVDHGIPTDGPELEAFLHRRRQMLGLGDQRSMAEYCQANGVDLTRWNELVTDEFLRERLKPRIISEASLRAYFDANRDGLEKRCLGRIVMDDRREAETIARRIRSGEEEFSSMAREHSQEYASRVAGGYVGCFPKGGLPEEIERELFKADPPAIKGPFQQNGAWVIYQVLERINADWNEMLIGQLRDRLFREWLQREVARVEV